MTEEEFMKKWCPLVRSDCIGSACVMFRSEMVIDERRHPPGSILIEGDRIFYTKKCYCGLAGKP